MADIIRMPRMSDTMEEGNIIGWLKNVGDPIEPGDVLAEVETDKATMELESYQEGTLLYIGVKEGTVPVNGVLAVIGDKGEDFQHLLDDATSTPAKKTAEVTTTPEVEQKVAEQVPQASRQETKHSLSNGRIFASPLAKQMAKERNIDISAIQGTGENGRIVKKDVEAYNTPASTTNTTTIVHSTESYDIPVSQMRKVIARRLGESKFSAPHFYLTVEINMTNTMQVRKSLNDVAESKISYNDIVIKCCAHALKSHPMVNASWHGDKIRMNGDINIGVAVGIEEGLLVPVVKNADQKSLTVINAEVKELAGRAKIKKLQPQEMQGNTFTISNLGMFGIEEFTAIINPPDACILAVGGIITKPIVSNGEIVIGQIMKITLSCDHRVVDGVKGSQFLNTVKSLLEDPVRILI